MHFEPLSAVFSGVADLRKVFEAAKQAPRRADKEPCSSSTRFIASTARSRTASCLMSRTAPSCWSAPRPRIRSFELNGALLSRCQVFVLRRSMMPRSRLCSSVPRQRSARNCRSSDEARHALQSDGRWRWPRSSSTSSKSWRCSPAGRAARQRRPDGARCNGARRSTTSRRRATTTSSARCINRCAAPMSMRRSTGSRACLTGGEHPIYIARRLVRMASEDIGLADPQALPLALAAWDAYERLGSPEGELALGRAVDLSRDRAEIERRLYRVLAPPSRCQGERLARCRRCILNAPTRLMQRSRL